MLRAVLPCLVAALALASPSLARVDADLPAPDAAMGSTHTYVLSAPVVLAVRTGLGPGDPDGAGSLYCHGELGHHDWYGPLTAHDLVFGAGVTFDVTSDTIDVTTLGDGCGDFQADYSAACAGACTVTFPPGLDGAYVVYVTGTTGTVDA